MFIVQLKRTIKIFERKFPGITGIFYLTKHSIVQGFMRMLSMLPT